MSTGVDTPSWLHDKLINHARFFTNETIRYDAIEQFYLDSKAECNQLNLAHETKTKHNSAQKTRA